MVSIDTLLVYTSIDVSIKQLKSITVVVYQLLFLKDDIAIQNSHNKLLVHWSVSVYIGSQWFWKIQVNQFIHACLYRWILKVLLLFFPEWTLRVSYNSVCRSEIYKGIQPKLLWFVIAQFPPTTFRIKTVIFLSRWGRTSLQSREHE